MKTENEQFDSFLKMVSDTKKDEPTYNGKDCGKCNCVEIAEYKNGGNGVKSMPCLKPHDEDTIKQKPTPNTITQYNREVSDELNIRAIENVYAFERDYFNGAHDLFIILRNKGLLK